MVRARLSMRKIKEVLRLKHTYALSKRQISQICNISRSTVGEYLERADKAGISWPLPEGLTDQELEQRLFRLSGFSLVGPDRCRISIIFTASSRRTRNSISRWICCGGSTKNNTRMAISTRSSVGSIDAGRKSSIT